MWPDINVWWIDEYDHHYDESRAYDMPVHNLGWNLAIVGALHLAYREGWYDGDISRLEWLNR